MLGAPSDSKVHFSTFHQLNGQIQDQDRHGGDDDAAAAANDDNDENMECDLPTMNEAICMSILPNTASLPPFTAHSDSVMRKPKEKLSTVLKQSERLLREAAQQMATSKRKTVNRGGVERKGKLESFIMSLRDDKLKRQTVDGPPSSLSKLLPAKLNGIKPHLSMDNGPSDLLEIVVDDDDRSGQGRRGRPANILRRAVAPKMKKLSTLIRCEMLDKKIREQQERERNGARLKEEKRTVSFEKDEAIEDYVFGYSDHDENEGESESESECNDENDMLNSPASKMRTTGRIVDSDDENDLNGISGTRQPDFRVEGIKDDIIESDDNENGNVDNAVKEASQPVIQIADIMDDLSLMLSGKFPDKDHYPEEESEKDGKQAPLPNDPLDKDEGDNEDDADQFGHVGGFLDEEAEDEDSNVSADEIDEEAIEEELRESGFLVNEREQDDDDDNTEADANGTQSMLYREIQQIEEEREMEMFMNRFVPDKVLKEQGIHVELRKKYRDSFNDNGKIDQTAASVGIMGRRSTFGLLGSKRLADVEASQSHPDFLKLLEQDRLSWSQDDVEEEEEEEAKAIYKDCNKYDHADNKFIEHDNATLIATDACNDVSTCTLETTMESVLRMSSFSVSAIASNSISNYNTCILFLGS